MTCLCYFDGQFSFDLGLYRKLFTGKLWKDFFTTVDGVVYIVDALDRERFPEAKKELDQLLTDEMLSNTPFLVLGNKIDLPNAVGEDELRQQLGLMDTFGKDTKPDSANGVRPIGKWLIDLLFCDLFKSGNVWFSSVTNNCFQCRLFLPLGLTSLVVNSNVCFALLCFLIQSFSCVPCKCNLLSFYHFMLLPC